MPQVFNIESKIVITCPKRITPWLRLEVEALGFKVNSQLPTAIQLQGSLEDCIKLNLNLRCAHQVLFSLKTFQAKDHVDLYEAILLLPWEEWVDPKGYFSVSSYVVNETIRTPLYANLKVKDAIADRIKSKKGIRPDSGPESTKTVIHLHWVGDTAEVFFDTSGETLSKHGYRKFPGKAPLQESLAAALIYASEWAPETPFINPMCGSGTLAIEAALIATGRVPGLLRMNYGFMHIMGYDAEAFYRERRSIKTRIIKDIPTIVATDISADAIRIAELNAKTAGVEKYIKFAVCDFSRTDVPDGEGVVMFNPEYGQRLGDPVQLEGMYKRVGDFMKQKCAGHTGFIFTANPNLAKAIGLRASQKIPFYNGTLDCRLLKFELYTGSRR